MPWGEIKKQLAASFEEEVESTIGVQGGEMRGARARGDCALCKSVPSSRYGGSG